MSAAFRPSRPLARTLSMAVLFAALLFAALLVAPQRPAPASASAAATIHTITYDSYSLSIDGRRTFIWSGEFHPFRLPSPDLWLDVLQKMKASGYNAVSIYFDWGYFSPKQGVYDFTGIRDMDKLLDLAQQVGLYVIARPGPYINGETDAGGFPGWLLTQAGKARTNAADYLAATDEWQTQIDAILARHQLTNGTGPVILYQIENELGTGTAQSNYLQHLAAKAHADGITVPIFHNDKGRNGDWVPSSSTVSGTTPGPVDLYAFDGYPGGTCHTDATPGSPSAAPDWGIYGSGGATGGSSASPNTPGFAAEFGGGWFDYWGSNGTYPCMATREGPGYERVFYGTNIANRLTIENFYMTVGGTSWGWLPAPVVYTSYDYGAAISASRQLEPKAATMKELGYFLQSVDPITKVNKSTAVTPSSTAVKIYHNVNPDTGTHFYFAVHNPSSATTNDTFTFPISTSDGNYTIPQSGTLRLNGQDAKTLVADYDVDGQHLVYSTSEIMTHLQYSNRSVLLLYGRDGETGETVLRYSSAPTVTVASGAAVTSTYNAATGDLRLDYTHSGIVQVQVSGGGRPNLLLLLADQSTADTMWRQDTAAGPVLERGPALVRTAAITGSTLALTGDTAAAAALEVWAPPAVTSVTWNGAAVATRITSVGSLATTTQLAGPAAVTLPNLATATWRYSVESPEKAPGFDDSSWATANKTTTNSTTKPPAGQPVLAAGVAAPPTTGTATFTVPAADRTTGSHVLSVMVRDDSHNEDGGVNDAQKQGRGLISASYANASGGALAPSVTWKIQGNQGGENITDTARGVMNNGGLFGERNGWYLPGFPDSSWTTHPVPDTTAVAGTQWYRTTFTLAVPTADDASIGLTIGNPATPRSGGNYRVLIFVNGWNMGQYIGNVGPQHTFVLPNGILNPRGSNTLALAVTSDGGSANTLESVQLTNLHTVLGGVPVSLVSAPGYAAP